MSFLDKFRKKKSVVEEEDDEPIERVGVGTDPDNPFGVDEAHYRHESDGEGEENDEEAEEVENAPAPKKPSLLSRIFSRKPKRSPVEKTSIEEEDAPDEEEEEGSDGDVSAQDIFNVIQGRGKTDGSSSSIVFARGIANSGKMTVDTTLFRTRSPKVPRLMFRIPEWGMSTFIASAREKAVKSVFAGMFTWGIMATVIFGISLFTSFFVVRQVQGVETVVGDVQKEANRHENIAASLVGYKICADTMQKLPIHLQIWPILSFAAANDITIKNIEVTRYIPSGISDGIKREFNFVTKKNLESLSDVDACWMITGSVREAALSSFGTEWKTNSAKKLQDDFFQIENRNLFFAEDDGASSGVEKRFVLIVWKGQAATKKGGGQTK